MKNLLIVFLAITVLMMFSATVFAGDKDNCKPWQHKENGKCVDDVGAIHYHGHHEPAVGEECWIECLCYEGQYPSGQSCSPCSYVGIVCISY